MRVSALIWFWFAVFMAAPLSAPAMDLARIETRVDDAVAKYGITGKSVIVALLDRGIDWRNNDFRNADGTTRIAAILDLTDDTGAMDLENPYGLGTLYSRAQINDALKNGTPLAIRDAIGHGTTTAGISCGNGNNLWKYRGVAYQATIVIVKYVAENVPAHDDQPAEYAFYDPTRLPTALNFVRDQSAALGMPAVMLLNIGSVGGPMDGTSSTSQLIDATVGPGIPGLVFVTGSSDDGGMPNHASGTIAQNQTADISITKGNDGPLIFDLWYGNNDRFDVTVQTPDGTFGPYLSPPTDTDYDNETTDDFIYYQLGGRQNFYGTARPEREIYFNLTGPLGEYTISLTGAQISNGLFHASLNPSRFWDPTGNSNLFNTFVAPGGEVWDVGSSSNNICPGDYVHRTNWTDIDGFYESNAGQGNIGQIWLGSGNGPAYDGRVGIDVTAPGDSTFTTYATNSYWELARFNLIEDGEFLYGRASAVSGANPIVTGIIALMLQMNPHLDAAQVKQLLHQSARADSFTGPVPNPVWGYGKVDALAALAAVQKTLPLLTINLSTNNQPQITVTQTIPGWTYILQTSTNLTTWSPIQTNSPTTASYQYLDPAPSTTTRFYRTAIR